MVRAAMVAIDVPQRRFSVNEALVTTAPLTCTSMACSPA
jgi:hypothetical protein